MSDDSATQTPATANHRTWPDVVAELVQALGKAAPAAIIVGGLLFAFYAFYGLVTGTKQEQLDAAQEEVHTARAHLLDTFNTLNSFTKGQLESLQDLMELREKAEFRAREAETKVREVQDFIDEKEEIQNQLVQVYAQLEIAKNELDGKRQQLKQNESDYQAKLQQRAKRIETLTTSSQAGIAAEQISAIELLSGFSREPDEESAAALRDLVGISTGKFVEAMHNDLGYAFWLAASEWDNDKIDLYIGLSIQSEFTYGYPVSVEVDEVVVDAEGGLSELLALRYPQVTNWNFFDTSVLVRDKEYGMEFYPAMFFGTNWSLSEFLLATEEVFSAKREFGEEKHLPILSVSEFRSNFPGWMESVRSIQESDVALSIEMTLRAEQFDSANMLVPQAVPDDLKETLLIILTAAVARRPAVLNEFVSPLLDANVFGEIAAATLQENFLITTYDNTSGEIVAQYGSDRVASQWKQARFQFAKDLGGRWYLNAFAAESGDARP